ncbi:MAG: DUF6167 family protein [Mycobacteriales bacterium]|jgi:hypothetical protein
MRRLFWLAAGAAAGVVAVRQVGRIAHKFTPAGAAQSAAGGVHRVGDRVRAFADDVRAGMAEREYEIHRAIEEGPVTVHADEDDAALPTTRQPGRFDTTDTSP